MFELLLKMAKVAKIFYENNYKLKTKIKYLNKVSFNVSFISFYFNEIHFKLHFLCLIMHVLSIRKMNEYYFK
jgi:hypothetical protein